MWDVWRKRVEFTDLLAGFREVYKRHGKRIIVENKHFGPAVYSMLRGEMPITTIDPGTKGKTERAAPLCNMLERGEVFLPKHNAGWKADLEAEWLSFTGLDEETSDQVDVASYAAIIETQQGGSWGGVVNV